MESQAQPHAHSQPNNISPSPSRLGDRTKRDEWSEGAVACLLDAYESKWALRNRAKLKGHDWEDVARQVSSRAPARLPLPPAKTPTQCKNKIESMKKRYRSESAAGPGSRWPLFPRLDGLVRCRPPAAADPAPADRDRVAAATAPSLPPPPLQPSGRVAQEECVEGGRGRAKLNETDNELAHGTPSYDSQEKQLTKKKKKKMNKREEIEGWEVVESIHWLAEATLKVEQARMDTMREVEKIRAQAEAKKGEMDLKCTEIIVDTQLQIAKLLAGRTGNVDSSMKAGSG